MQIYPSCLPACPAQVLRLLTGVEAPGVLVLGFVKFEAGIARINARPDGLARGSEQLGGGGGAGGGMCHARAWINWWRGVAAASNPPLPNRMSLCGMFDHSLSETLCTVISDARPSHYEVPLNEIGHLFNPAGLFEN